MTTNTTKTEKTDYEDVALFDKNWKKKSLKGKINHIALIIMFLVFGIYLIMIMTGQAEAGGLGHSYLLENGGTVSVTVVKEPHQDYREWGYVYNGTQTTVGYTSEGQTFDLGWFDEEAQVVFWVAGKNKVFYTGKSNKATTDDQFVINGTHFEIDVEEGNSEMVGTTKQITETVVVAADAVDIASRNDCSDPNVVYNQGRKVKFEMVASRDGYDSLRVVMNVQNNWTLLRNGEITAEVTLNDSCEHTFSATDEINYFTRPDKDYEGHRLVEYKFPEGITYFGKLRVTTEKGVDKHYIYLNNVDAWDLVGQTVNVKVRLYQDGDLVQAFEMDAKMDQKIKR